MSKKSLDKKAARKFIRTSRETGKTDQEIYHELVQLYYDKKGVALLITGTTTDENKARYKLFNAALLVLIGITVLFKLFLIAGLTLQTQKPATLLLIFILPLLNIYFFYEIARMSAPAYRFLGIWTLIGLFRSFENMANTTDVIINLIMAGAITALAFYLDRKLFPNYRPQNMQKNNNGDFIFDN